MNKLFWKVLEKLNIHNNYNWLVSLKFNILVMHYGNKLKYTKILVIKN